MCGFVAAVAAGGAKGLRPHVTRAGLALERRGPDGHGVFLSGACLMEHRRLAIIDPGPRSDQPMHSPDGRYTIAFNGEIYNHRSLAAEVADQWELRTSSDTEVLLALFAKEGERMLPRLRGMFAFAIWDALLERMFLARDAYGIKPLYYAQTPEGFICASTVKSIMATGLVSREPDPVGQASYWLTGSVWEPNTWYRQVRELSAGHCGFVESRGSYTFRCWQQISDSWATTQEKEGSQADVGTAVAEAVKSSITAHLVADVPMGLFLSGGIDSGAIAGVASELGTVTPVTVAYGEYAGTAQDERVPAQAIADRYGLKSSTRWVTKQEFLADLPRILSAMDQPSIDGVNTWFAAKAVSELGLKTALAGTGGDELFQGYSHFRTIPKVVRTWTSLSGAPGVDAAMGHVVRALARRSDANKWLDAPQLARTVPGAWLLRRGLFSSRELPALMGEELAREALTTAPLAHLSLLVGELPSDPRLAISVLESTMYLRNQLLRDADWAGMAHSVEIRTPLVDSTLLSQLAPLAAHFATNPAKLHLARSPALALPDGITKRKKTGFGIPINKWLPQPSGHPTRDWAVLAAGAADA